MHIEMDAFAGEGLDGRRRRGVRFFGLAAGGQHEGGSNDQYS
jgi:hypothetical protein